METKAKLASEAQLDIFGRPVGVDHKWANHIIATWLEIHHEFYCKVNLLLENANKDAENNGVKEVRLVTTGNNPLMDIAIGFK